MSQNLIYIANSGAANYGITVAALDASSGSLQIVQQVTEISECHYLNPHPSGKFLLATTMDEGVQLVSFAIADDGSLRKRSAQPAAGTSPAYICADHSGRHVLLVNYVNAGKRGNIRVYSIDSEGIIGAHSEHIEIDDKTGPKRERQDASHPHMIVPTPDGRYVVVPDLGTDTVYLFALDTAAGTLTLAQRLPLPGGAGPRHAAFHPSLPRMYVINELGSTLATFDSVGSGSWPRLSLLPTLPMGHQQPPSRPNITADVHVHPGGKFLYGSNRGHDSIVIYALDEGGLPRLVGHQATGGQWPRAFMIDPPGEHLIVGNRHSNDVTVFAIDTSSGLLRLRSRLDLDAPIALKARKFAVH